MTSFWEAAPDNFLGVRTLCYSCGYFSKEPTILCLLLCKKNFEVYKRKLDSILGHKYIGYKKFKLVMKENGSHLTQMTV